MRRKGAALIALQLVCASATLGAGCGSGESKTHPLGASAQAVALASAINLRQADVPGLAGRFERDREAPSAPLGNCDEASARGPVGFLIAEDSAVEAPQSSRPKACRLGSTRWQVKPRPSASSMHSIAPERGPASGEIFKPRRSKPNEEGRNRSRHATRSSLLRRFFGPCRFVASGGSSARQSLCLVPTVGPRSTSINLGSRSGGCWSPSSP